MKIPKHLAAETTAGTRIEIGSATVSAAPAALAFRRSTTTCNSTGATQSPIRNIAANGCVCLRVYDLWKYNQAAPLTGLKNASGYESRVGGLCLASMDFLTR
jgi:hypothetical protein